jgi:hypothetical protein
MEGAPPQNLMRTGDTGRLRQALDRYRKGRNLTIAVVGGSISAGGGAVDMHVST